MLDAVNISFTYMDRFIRMLHPYFKTIAAKLAIKMAINQLSIKSTTDMAMSSTVRDFAVLLTMISKLTNKRRPQAGMASVLHVAAICSLLLTPAVGINVLILHPVYAGSHELTLRVLGEQMVARGHNVTQIR